MGCSAAGLDTSFADSTYRDFIFFLYVCGVFMCVCVLYACECVCMGGYVHLCVHVWRPEMDISCLQDLSTLRFI